MIDFIIGLASTYGGSVPKFIAADLSEALNYLMDNQYTMRTMGYREHVHFVDDSESCAPLCIVLYAAFANINCKPTLINRIVVEPLWKGPVDGF